MKLSSKKIFSYFSLSLILGYFTFILICINSGIFPGIYDVKQSGICYIVIYVLLCATAYVIDTQTKKEPAFLTLFCLPVYTLAFLSLLMFLSGVGVGYYLVLGCLIILLIMIGYPCYKKWISKILLIKKGYENILAGYIIIHLFIALLISFKMVGFL